MTLVLFSSWFYNVTQIYWKLLSRSILTISYLIKEISGPLGDDQRDDNRECVGYLSRGLYDDDRQRDGHAHHAAQLGRRADKGKLSRVQSLDGNHTILSNIWYIMVNIFSI